MNVQIFGTKKSSDTRKAERWFKERRVKYQYIDLLDKGISRGELRSVAACCGGLDALEMVRAGNSWITPGGPAMLWRVWRAACRSEIDRAVLENNVYWLLNGMKKTDLP